MHSVGWNKTHALKIKPTEILQDNKKEFQKNGKRNDINKDETTKQKNSFLKN